MPCREPHGLQIAGSPSCTAVSEADTFRRLSQAFGSQVPQRRARLHAEPGEPGPGFTQDLQDHIRPHTDTGGVQTQAQHLQMRDNPTVPLRPSNYGSRWGIPPWSAKVTVCKSGQDYMRLSGWGEQRPEARAPVLPGDAGHRLGKLPPSKQHHTVPTHHPSLDRTLSLSSSLPVQTRPVCSAGV